MLVYIVLSAVLAVVSSSVSQNVSVVWEATTNKFTIQNGFVKKAVVTAQFTNEIFQTGWSYLEVKSDDQFPDSVQAYAAGLAEGYLTQDLLKKHWNNVAASYCNGEDAYCKRLEAFLTDNLNYMNVNIEINRTTDIYWHQIALILEQLSGLEDGFHNKTQKPRTNPEVMGLMLLNVMGDLEDLEALLNRSAVRRPLGGGSCSGLVKVLPNNKDLYFSQDTWTGYNTMLRILKKIDLKLHISVNQGSPIVPGHTAAFSSNPGSLGSGDDFYVLSSGLATMETTIGNGNSSLWKYINSQGTILEWMRSILANRLAKNGQQWTEILSLQNSGTYNNQWMVVDYNKFQSGKPLQDDLLWVSEQLPGYIHNADMTSLLREQSYWPSYNVPYFKDVFNMSGGQINAEKYGDWFTYERTPRALIFKREQVKIHDIPSMIKVMRYNDYTHDPLSKCNCTPPYSGENAISARSDLNPKNGTYPFSALGHRNHGGIDMKLTTSTLFSTFKFVAIGGPTHESVPPFQWSKSDFNNVPHDGQPDLWNFKPIVYQWKL